MSSVRVTRNRKVGIETRAEGQRFIVGYAAVFYNPADEGTEYDLGFGITERINAGAFNRALSEQQDVRALYNHEDCELLGRSSAGTLKLSVDGKGLYYEILVDQLDTDVANVVRKIERGDITGSSFGFNPTVTTYTEQSDGSIVREIVDCDLIDVSPVTFPAYESTTAAARGLVKDSENIQREVAEWKSKRNKRNAIDLEAQYAKSLAAAYLK